MQRKDLLEGLLLNHFLTIPDPRVTGRCKHRLFDIVIIALCGVASGCSCWVEIEEFAEVREDWLRSFLELPGGIPSHDTMARVFSLIEPTAMEEILISWSKGLAKRMKHLCIDGKSVSGTRRGFINTGEDSRPLHLLNIYCPDQNMVMGQIRASGPMGEMASALEYLKIAALEGALVTVDAAMSVRRVTDQIVESGGDYLVPIKKNQKYYLESLEKQFNENIKKAKEASVISTTHARKEKRICHVLEAKGMDEKFYEQWKEIKTIALIKRIRERKDSRNVLQKRDENGKNYYENNTKQVRKSEQLVYFISSRKLGAEEVIEATRNHWSIENKLHWTLDTVFLEDQWRVRQKIAAENLSTIRKIVFNMFKKCPEKGSGRIKMKRASFSTNYLERLITMDHTNTA